MSCLLGMFTGKVGKKEDKEGTSQKMSKMQSMCAGWVCESTWVFFSRLVTLPIYIYVICIYKYIYFGNFDMFERQGGLHAKLQVCFRPRHEAEPRTAVETHQLRNSMVKILAHLHPNYSRFDLLLYGKTKFFRLHSEFVQNG
jgi:hypothetical protein